MDIVRVEIQHVEICTVDDFPMFSLLELADKYVKNLSIFISRTIENSPENYAKELLLSFNRFSSVSCIGAFPWSNTD